MELISIVVPVYKVEPYLDKCVSSIVNQTYKNLEIILVDDGSPDNCPAMCDAWAEKDNRIRVIHKPNGGLSDARNAGMSVATGELMAFVDSDDWIAPDMYEKLYHHLTEDGSDIAACGVQMVWENNTPPRLLTRPGSRTLNRDEAMQAIIEESWLKQPVYYKLYKSKLVRDICFPVGKYHEDVFWSYQAVGKTSKVSVSDYVGYYYLQRGGSIMGEGYSIKRLDAIEAKVRRCDYMREHFPQLFALSLKDLWFSCIYQGQCAVSELDSDDAEKVLTFLKSELIANPHQANACTIKEKIWLIMAKISLAMTCQIRDWLKIGL